MHRSPPHTRAAFSAMASRTGCRSVGELAMTRRISLVAVCCSSDSVSSRLRVSSSVNRRTFSMAITAWSAKVCSQRDLPVREGLYLVAPHVDGTDRLAFAQERRGQHRSSRDTRARGSAASVPFRGIPSPHARMSATWIDCDHDRAPMTPQGSRRWSRRSARRRQVTMRGHERRDSPSGARSRIARVAQSRGAFATTSITGWTSVGELEITRRISLVAVCCSSASFVSLKSRTFSMAITAWAAKVWSSAICFSENGGRHARAQGDGTDRSSLSQERHRQVLSGIPASTRLRGPGTQDLAGVGDVDDLTIQNGTASRRVRGQSRGHERRWISIASPGCPRGSQRA